MSSEISSTAGDSRMSSTFFLYAMPSTRMRLPLTDFSCTLSASMTLPTTQWGIALHRAGGGDQQRDAPLGGRQGHRSAQCAAEIGQRKRHPGAVHRLQEIGRASCRSGVHVVV